MRIAIMQPTYLPWLGYFELVDNCELFILLDDVQFVRKSWHQRNKIKSSNGELLLTVPVFTKGKREQLIKDVQINNNLPWMKKHLLSIDRNYRKAPHYKDYIREIEKLYSRPYTSLLTLNMRFIEFIKGCLGIKTEIVLSSEFNAQGNRTEKVINICRACKADILYNAGGAADILDLDLFRENNIETIFQEYKHPVYQQLYGDFISHLSTLDLLLNVGQKSLEIIRSGSRELAYSQNSLRQI